LFDSVYNGKESFGAGCVDTIIHTQYNKTWAEREGRDYIHVMDPIEEFHNTTFIM